MYTKYGDEKKAKAHMGRAMRYYSSGGSTRFGAVPWPVDPRWRFEWARVHGGRGEGIMQFGFIRTDGRKATMIVKGLSDAASDNTTMQYIISFGSGVISTDEATQTVPSLLNALLSGVNIAGIPLAESQISLPADHPAFAEFKRGHVWQELKLKTGPASDRDKGASGLPFSTMPYTADIVLSKLIEWTRKGKLGFYVGGAEYTIDVS
jgi:hypothetical protein